MLFRTALRCPSSWLCLMYLHLALGQKDIVFFAGPHKAASSSISRFFHNHGSGYNNAPIAAGLKGWIWPPVYGKLVDRGQAIGRHKIFNLLVTETKNATVQNALYKGITTAWGKAQKGLIIGSEEFDRVGDNPHTQFDAIKAMEAVVYKLEVPSSRVTVVLNYRTPRLDQWISIFKHSTAAHYKSFLCGHEHSEERWELLDTAMNPLKLAVEYRKRGWKVVVIDMGGVAASNLDVTHVIACEVLTDTDCQDGFVTDKANLVYHENENPDKDLGSLKPQDKRDLEQLLRERDCHYEKKLLQDSGFRLLYNDTIWNGCLQDQENQALYEKLTDTDYLVKAMKTQKKCEGHEDKVHMHDVLVGDYDNMTTSTIVEKIPASGTFGTMAEEPLLLARQTKKGESPLTTGLFLLIIVGGSMYQLSLMYHPRRNPQLPGEQELEEMPSFATTTDDVDSEYGDSDRMVSA